MGIVTEEKHMMINKCCSTSIKCNTKYIHLITKVHAQSYAQFGFKSCSLASNMLKISLTFKQECNEVI